jgi:DegV family protein with EDD domain
MGGVRIVTDSACDLSEALAEAHGITIVPLFIRFGDEELTDRRDLGPTEFWARCQASAELPTTAAPASGAFQEAYLEAAEQGYDAVVCCTISSALSATYESAVNAAEAVAGRIPVTVVDTRSVTLGEGLLTLAAAERAAAGAGLDEVVDAVQTRIPLTRVYGVLATLDHLQRGGRIGGARALLGSLLSIKPVIQVRDGVVAEESKQRTRSRSLEYLVAKARADAPFERVAIASGAAQDVEVVVNALAGVATDRPMLVSELGPVVGTHAGPGTIGVAYVLPGPGQDGPAAD